VKKLRPAGPCPSYTSNMLNHWQQPGDVAWRDVFRDQGEEVPLTRPPAAAQQPGRPLLPPWPRAVPGQDWAPSRGHGRTRFDPDENLALASWLPVKPGLVPHGLRHGHETWMIEDGIPEVLRHDRLGHQMQGIQATYAHVSQPMRDELKRALQWRWETALDQRGRMCPRSPVALLDELLPPACKGKEEAPSPKYPNMGETLSP
jgi:hypothetical protein